MFRARIRRRYTGGQELRRSSCGWTPVREWNPTMKNKPSAGTSAGTPATAETSAPKPGPSPAGARKKPALDAAAIRAKEKEFLWPSLAHYYEEPIALESGKGLRVRDTSGREYLDFFGGILT